MKTINYILLISGIAILSGCGVYTNITVSADPNVKLSSYHSFAWLPDVYDSTHSPYNNQVIRNNLRNYFGQALVARGFVANRDTPDVLVQITLTNKKQEREVAFTYYPYYYYRPYYFLSRYYSPYYYDYYYNRGNVYCYASGLCVERIPYMESSIILNVIDRKENKLIWTCTAQGDVFDPSLINQDIHPAVKRIMRKFPLTPVSHYKQSIKQSTTAYHSTDK